MIGKPDQTIQKRDEARPLQETSETSLLRGRRDAGFRFGLLREAVECIVAGETEAGKSLLRDGIHVALGFRASGRAWARQWASLAKA